MSTVETDKYENEFSDFLIKRIQSFGGSIKFQHISGHLSQVSLNVRKHVVCSLLDVKNFLKRHPNLFKIENDTVSLVDSVTENYDYDQNRLPQKITKGKGVIVKLLENYGFLNAKDPIKTSVYFSAKHFGDENIDLTNFGLNIGTMLYFNAVKESGDKFTSKYKATKVWKINKTGDITEPVIPKSRKNRETGLYDPLSTAGDGTIQNVFPNLGFIAVDGDYKNIVFFHKKRVVNVDNIVDLTKVFERGEVVEFKAHRSTKQDTKARWEATQVWKKSGKMFSSKNSVIFESSNQEDKSCSQSSYSGSSHKTVHSVINKYLNNSSREVISNQRGKICPRAHGAVIKFGEKYSQLADGDSSTYFEKGTKVEDISWVFSEDDDVWFDAVKIKSAPGWKAILVWRGDKPDIDLPLFLDDFVYNTDEELDEISETFSYTSKSSCLSESSYTSVQSENSKSESLHYGRSNKKSKWNSVKLDEVLDKVSSKSSLDSRKCSSFTSSQNSLCSSTESKQLEKSRTNYEVDIQNNLEYNQKDIPFSNWADCPYPEEDYQSALPKDDMSNCVEAKEFLGNITDDKEDNEMELIEKYLESSEKKSQLYDEFIKDHKIRPSYSVENVVNECKDDVYLKNVDNIEKKASIKKFQNLNGEVIKVYSKFAEVKSPNLKKPLAFFWNTLYCNGSSVDDLHLYDLKEVIKVGDNIYFNYFEIIDDSSQFWQKVTVAWTGCKPKKYIEITPSEFIKQNNLSVHVRHETIPENSYEGKSTAKKFLTVVSDAVSNCDVEESMSMTQDIEEFGSVTRDESISITQDIEVSALATESSFGSEVFSGHACKPNEQSREITDFETLTNLISQILTKRLFMTDSKIDVRMLSRDILNSVRQYHDAEESDRTLQLFLPKEENKKSDLICSVCKERVSEKHSSNVYTEDIEIQTIITGDIIAQNIFTEC